MLTIAFLLAFVRISTLILAAPVLNSRQVPFLIRIGLGLLITLAVLPMILQQNPIPVADSTQLTTQLIPLFFSEAIIGGLIGLGVMIIYSAGAMVGTAIGAISGFQPESLTGGDSLEGSATTKLFGILSLAVFVLVGGFELTLSCVIDSFLELPIGEAIHQKPIVGLLVAVLRQSFELTLRAVCPAVAAVLISITVMGMISRTVPHLNLLQVGLSSNMAVLLTAIFLTLGGSIWLYVNDLENTLEFIRGSFNNLKLVER